MDTQYLVRKVEACTVCKGEKFFCNPKWEEVNMGFSAWMEERGKARMDDEAYTEWARLRAEAFPWGEPPEEEPCGECEGTGQVEKWIDLRQALGELEQERAEAQRLQVGGYFAGTHVAGR